jgi:nicotinamide-nucleotide amidase
MNNKTISAEIITIGTELLLGDIVDINTPFISKELNKLGIDIFRTITIGDNINRISTQINQSLANVAIVITTGGLGPTVDDPTREAVAHAFGVDLVFHDDLWQQIIDRFKLFHHEPTENNRKQAFLPVGAVGINNSIGTAPAFYMTRQGRILISLPGVPAEVQHIFQNDITALLSEFYNTGFTTLTRVIRTAGLGESSVDNLIGEYEKLSNPTVGVTAHPGQVDVRITAKAKDDSEAEAMIAPVENEIQEILAEYIYGYDNDTLEEVVIALARQSKNNMVLFYPSDRKQELDQIGIVELFDAAKGLENEELLGFISGGSLYNNITPHDIGIILNWVSLKSMHLVITIIVDDKIRSSEFFFGGHESLIHEWFKNQVLNSIRKILLEQVK